MELDNLIQESIKIMEEDFYQKKFYFSYSSLNKLMWCPQAFYQTYVLGQREERTDAHLIQGKIIHALLLEEDKFNDNFVISPSNLPTGNQKTVIDRVFSHYVELKRNGDDRESLSDFSGAILDVMKDMNYHQALKTDQQRFDKVLTADSESYWNFLKTRESKTLIDQQSYDFCKTAVDLIKLNKDICSLIGCNVTEFDNIEVQNELLIQANINGKSFGIKGIVDNLVIDHDKKMVYINDIKTTSKDLKDFTESIDFYNYWMQASIYITLVGIKYSNLIDAGYNVKFNFVVIDKAFQVYPFEVSENTMTNWYDKFTECLEKANWHISTKSYDLPYDFALRRVIL